MEKAEFFFCSLPPLPAGGSAVGEEGRGGEGPDGADPAESAPSLPAGGSAVGEEGRGGEGLHQNNNRVRKKSEIRIAIDATTTAAVVERPTPSAPPVV